MKLLEFGKLAPKKIEIELFNCLNRVFKNVVLYPAIQNIFSVNKMENGSRKVGLRIAAGFLVAITIIIAVFASGITLPSQEDLRTTLPTQQDSEGKLTILLMDAPVEVDALWINMTALEVHKAGEGDGEWITIDIQDAIDASTPPNEDERDYLEFDLLTYQYGKVLTLTEAEAITGTYNKIRLTVTGAEAWSWDEEKPDLVLDNDGYPIIEEDSNDVIIRPLRVPPNRIDVIIDFTVETEGEVTVTLDMQPDLIAISHSNNLRPVMKATVEYEGENQMEASQGEQTT
jgi:hypothetical protein